MSDSKKPAGQPDDGWVEIGHGQPRKKAPANSLVDDADAAPQEEKVFTSRKGTPPGTISLRVGAIALAVMLILYIFADVRDIQVPWQRQFRFGYILLLIPALGVFWGLVGLVKREPDDVRRAFIGIVLSLASLGIAYGTIAARRAEVDAQPAMSGRAQLAPKDLSQWREEKLRRKPAESAATPESTGSN